MYVEKLPKGCLSCPYIVDKGDYDLCAIKDCVIDDAFKYIDKRKKSCPLQSLADYTKQVRKEVCEEIRKWCNRNFNWVGDGTGYDGQDYNEMIGSNNTINKLRELLYQIQDKGE